MKVKYAVVPERGGLTSEYAEVGPPLTVATATTAAQSIMNAVYALPAQTSVVLYSEEEITAYVRKHAYTAFMQTADDFAKSGAVLVGINGEEVTVLQRRKVATIITNKYREAASEVASSGDFLGKAASVGLAVAGLLELAQAVYAPPPRPEDVASLALAAGMNCFFALTMFDGNPLGGVALLGCGESLAATVLSFTKLLAENKQYIAVVPGSAKQYYAQAVRMLQSGYGLADRYGYYMYSGLVGSQDAATYALLTRYGYDGYASGARGGQSSGLLSELPPYPVRLPKGAEEWIAEHSGMRSAVKILGGGETAKEVLRMLQRYRFDPSPSLESQLLSRIRFVSVPEQPLVQLPSPLLSGAASSFARAQITPQVSSLAFLQPLLSPLAIGAGSALGLGLASKIIDMIKAGERRVQRIEERLAQLESAGVASLSGLREDLVLYADEAPVCCEKDIQTGKRPIKVPKGLKLPPWALPKMGVKPPSFPFLGTLTAAGAGIALLVRLLEKVETGA